MPRNDAMRSWFAAALLPQGWTNGVRIVAEHGRIASLETGVEPSRGDERHRIAIPGLPNLHSHAFQRGMAGLTEVRDSSGNSFWSWRELMYRFVDRVDPEDLEALAAWAYVEMLESGFTRVGEFHYVHHDRDGSPYSDPAQLSAALAAAAAESGIALTLLPVFYAHGGFGGQAPQPEQRRFVTDLDGFARIVDAARPLVARLPAGRLGVAPHSLRAVTARELSSVAKLVSDGPVHIHVAEQTKEVDDCLASCGSRPVEWLFAHADVDARWCLVHATHVSESELAAVAASGAVVGLCPITEANLGDGVFPADRLLRAGGRFGIGSDSNVLIDAAEELRVLEYGQRLTLRGRNVLAGDAGGSTGRRLFDAALAGGSRALGMTAAAGDGTAGLVVGAHADLVSLKGDHPALIGRDGDAWLDGWIFSGGARLVDCVWRHGVKLVEAGEHRARGAILARYRKRLGRLLA